MSFKEPDRSFPVTTNQRHPTVRGCTKPVSLVSLLTHHEHLLRQAFWEGPGEFYVEHLVINCVICPTEIEGKEDERVGDASVLRSASLLRAVQAVLYRLDKPGQAFVLRSPSSETKLFRRNHPFAVRNVG